ncbi:MAG: ArsA family ATPase [Deltaproteobacteria bacterium]|nr:ArsA family ATPase [Deltaproteobacteria bacterium]
MNPYRILIVCGMGGVGKTTTAAAIGLAQARAGRRTLVMTIDPAKRLAQTLGVDLSAPTPTRVWAAAAGAPASPEQLQCREGALDALMLDTKRTFDRLIERYAPDPATAATILQNPLYRYLSTLIAGSQEYMAMEKLFEMLEEGGYDCIVVDTPPAGQAIDFIRAPQRLIRALTDSMLLLFVKPSMIAGKMGAKLLSKGADMLMGIFGRLAGAELLQEMADLLMSTVGLFGGFRERAAAVQAMVRDAATAFVLVTTPQPVVVRDAIAFARDIQRDGLHLGGVMVNRGLPPLVGDADCRAARRPASPIAAPREALAACIAANVARYCAAWQPEREALRALDAALPPAAARWRYPLQTGEMTELAALHRMADVF